MRDYYSLIAFFNSIDENGMYDHAAKVPSPSLLLPTDEQEAQLDAAARQDRRGRSCAGDRRSKKASSGSRSGSRSRKPVEPTPI